MVRAIAGCGLMVALSLVSVSAIAQQPGAGAASEAGMGEVRRCEVSERSRRHIQRSDGAWLYVEPRFAAPEGDGLVLAGQPTFAWDVDDRNRGTLLEEGSFFGVIVRGDSTVLLPLPETPGPIGWVEGTRLARDHYVFAFEVDESEALERDSSPRVAPPMPRRVLWAGDLVGGRWRSVQRLSIVGGGFAVPLSNGSRIIPGDATGDVTFALPFISDPKGAGVLVHERSGGRWSAAVMAPAATSAVDMRRSAGGIVELLRRRQGATDGGEEVILHPLDGTDPRTIGSVPAGVLVADLQWASPSPASQAAWRGHSADGSTAWIFRDGPRSTPVLVDRSAARLFRVHGTEATPWWLIHSTPTDTTHVLRVTRVGASGTAVATAPYPFEGPLVALQTSPDVLLVSGPEAHFDPVAPHVRSLLLELSLSCP